MTKAQRTDSHSISGAEPTHDRLADSHSLLFRYTDALYRAESLNEIYDASLDAICEGLGCTRAAILVLDANGVMRFKAWRGLSNGYRAAVEGHSPWPVGTRNPPLICIEDIANSTETEAIKTTVVGEGICGLAFIPLTAHDRLIGKFVAYYDVARLFTDRERELALIIARQLGFALECETGEGNARRLAAIVDSSQDPIISKALDGTITSWNHAAERLLGYKAEEVIGLSGAVLYPPDRVDIEPELLKRVAAGELVEAYETIRRCKDGRLVDVSLTISPLKDNRGNVIGASKIMRDETERRRAEERQALLLREMDHRVKNLFALAASLVQLSARSARTPGELAQSVASRLTALSRAHSLTMTGGSHQASNENPARSLHMLVGAVLQPFVLAEPGAPGRIRMEGDDVELHEEQVTPLALLLYELATNAVKYGGLSVPSGHVALRFRRTDEGLAIDWKEAGGPALAAGEVSEGFGGRLIAATAAQLGRIQHHWEPDGLHVEILVLLRDKPAPT